jgi:hypothetical protein
MALFLIYVKKNTQSSSLENNFTGKSVCSLSYPGDDLYRILGILFLGLTLSWGISGEPERRA